MAAEDRRNRNEQINEALDPLDLRPRIDRYAREGLASIDPDDLNIRFRWWGLYTQRPASDGHFMLRIRIPGGALSSDQLAAIGLPGGESAGEGNYQLHLGGDLGEGLAFGHRVRERVPATDTGAVVTGLVAGYLAGRETGESLQTWLRRQSPETLAAMSKPEGSGEPQGGAPVDREGSGEPQGGAPVDRAPVGSS